MLYPTALLVVLTALFAWSVRWWLRKFPVTPLNWDYERRYRPHAPVRYLDAPTNLHQVFAASATSAVWHVPLQIHDPRDWRA